MKTAYVDTSCLVAVALAEEGSELVSKRLDSYDLLAASNLLEAELRAALVREEVTEDPASLLQALTWVHPDRTLAPEYELVLDRGYVRGADLWHLACAAFLRSNLSGLEFLTLDRRQQTIAAELGFHTPLP